jgi:dTMP kinase|tara:strand:+ start:378 stop:1004 length:627 start_codon:yes stop_codon:yes gene_type:complete
MLKKKFYFIVFEGVEGTGKTYQINKLYKNLKREKFSIVKTREPGGSRTAEKIRNLIFSKDSNQFDKLTDFYLMCAARNEHVKKLLLNTKKNKKIVICDRFTDSTYAYQVVGNKIDKKLNQLNQDYILKGLKPNLTIVLKSNFETIFSRIRKRKKINKFDKLKIDFYKKAQRAFINRAKNKKNYHIFDSTENTSHLEKKIFKLIFNRLK